MLIELSNEILEELFYELPIELSEEYLAGLVYDINTREFMSVDAAITILSEKGN